MAGIINSNRQAQQAPSQAQPEEKVVGNDTPEQQDATASDMQAGYERLMEAFSKAVHSEGQTEAIVDSLNVDRPEAVIAVTVLNILAELDSQAEKKYGTGIPSELLIEAAQEGVELIAELGEAAGFYQFDEAMEARTYQALISQAIERGIIDRAEIEELMASMSEEEMQAAVQQQQQFAGGV